MYVVVCCVFYLLPESPAFLNAQNRHDEVYAVIQRIADFNGVDINFREKYIFDKEEFNMTEAMMTSLNVNTIKASQLSVMNMEGMSNNGSTMGFGVSVNEGEKEPSMIRVQEEDDEEVLFRQTGEQGGSKY